MASLNKVVSSYGQALAGFSDGMTVMVGGFGLCGIPEGLIRQVYQMKSSGLTCISNNAGVDGFGLGLWLEQKQIKKIYASYVGENALFEQQLLNGDIEVILTPQGTLAEKIRAAGCGIPAFYTATGCGTVVSEGKEIRQFNNRAYVLEEAFQADYALVKAHKADTHGNLIFNKTAMNFNPLMAMAAKVTVAEVEEIVEVGDLDPNHIHTPGIFVQRLIQGSFEKRIEQRTVQEEV